MLYVGDRPRLYDSTEKDFTNNGFGFLTEGVSCKVTEEINTSFELILQYPISGILFNELKIGRIITAHTNPNSSVYQPFRIYRITKPLNGILTVYAAHISYDLNGYISETINTTYSESEGSVSDLISYLNTAATNFSGRFNTVAFTFSSDVSKKSKWSITKPTDIRAIMKNAVSWFGGQWEFNGFNCILKERRGIDRTKETIIQHGKNIININEDSDNSETYNYVMPYFIKDDDTIKGNIANLVSTGMVADGTCRILPLDLTREFDEEPSLSDLNERAKEYIAKSTVGSIQISRKTNFINRGSTLEYNKVGDLDRIDIGDTVTIRVYPLNIDAEAVCNKVVYDVYLARYDNVEIGDLKTDIVKTIAELSAKTDSKAAKLPNVFFDDYAPADSPENNIVIKKGDYWFKIDDDVNMNAQSLGEYSGSQWIMKCNFANPEDPPQVFIQTDAPSIDEGEGITVNSGDYWLEIDSDTYARALHICENGNVWVQRCEFRQGGVGENIGLHNERFNDYSNNTIIGDAEDYNTVIGRNNTGSGYGNWVAGQNNQYLKLGSSNIAAGRQNRCNASYGPNFSILHGFGNDYNSQLTASICGGQNNYTSAAVNNSLIIGGGNVIDHALYDCVVCGNYGNPRSNAYLNIGGGITGVGPKNIFIIDDEGNAYASGTYNTTGSDFAELYEWLDGNPENEDRRGLLVSLDGEMIVAANGEDIIGAVSAVPTIIGNCDIDEWHGKYKRDVFGSLLKESNGNNVLSEDFDNSVEYIPRSERKEWAAVGLVGQLIVKDNGECEVNKYCIAENGIAVPSSQKTNVRVMKRMDDTHIKVLIR